MKARKAILVFSVLLLFFSVSWAVPTLINYEGRLANASGSALSGLYNMRFTITSDSGGSTAVWGPETHSGVSVEGGVFSVLLGQTIPFTTAEVAGNNLYLKVEVASPATSTTNYETLTPHSRIVSVAYALRAARADSLPADINIVTSGNVSAVSFSGDGSALTGVPAASLPPDINIQTTGVVTAAAYHGDGTYLTGLPGGGDITAVLAGPGLTGGATTGAATLNAAYDGATIGLSGANSLEVKDSGITSAKLAADIDITTSGSVSAASLVGTFYGDGSDLSGIVADTASYAALAGSASSAAYSILAGTATSAAYSDLSGLASTSAYADLSGAATSAATVSDYAVTATKIATSAVTAEKLSADAAVLSIAEQAQSRLTGNVDLKEGSNILLTQTGQTIEITSSSGGGTVTSVDSGTGLTGGPITGAGSLAVAPFGITSTLIATHAVTSEKIQNATITGDDLAADISFSTTGTVTASAFSGDGTGLSGITADTASYAAVAGTATTAASATTADTADYAAVAGTATTAASATTADTADYAAVAGTATTAATATTVAGYAITTTKIATSAVTSEKILNSTILGSDLAGNISIDTTGDIAAHNGTFNGSLTVEGTLFYVDAVTSTFEVIEINHGPTTVALTIRPSAESEGQSSIQVFRVNSSASPTFEVTSDGEVVGRLFTGDGSGLSNVNASSLDSGVAVLSMASVEAAHLSGNVDLRAGSGIGLTQTGQTIEIASSAGGGTVTSVDSGTGLAGGPITSSGTISATYGGSGGDWGTADTLARSDHLHDSDYVELSGDVMTGILRVPTLEVSASVYMWESGNNFYLYDPNAGSKTLSQLYTGIASQGATRLTSNVDLKAGSNVTLTQTGQTIEIASSGGAAAGIYGELYCANNAVAQSVDTTYVTVNALTQEGASNGMAVSSVAKRITAGTAGAYLVRVSVAFSGSNSQTFYGAVSKNGAVSDKIVFARKLGTGGDVGSASCSGIISLAAGEWVDFRIKSGTSGNSIVVQYANLSLSKL